MRAFIEHAENFNSDAMADAIGDSLLDASLPFLIGRGCHQLPPVQPDLDIQREQSISIFS